MRITISMPDVFIEYMDSLSKETGLNRSELLRRALEHYGRTVKHVISKEV